MQEEKNRRPSMGPVGAQRIFKSQNSFNATIQYRNILACNGFGTYIGNKSREIDYCALQGHLVLQLGGNLKILCHLF